MSENLNLTSVDEKIKGISDYLKASVLEPAEKQKSDLIKSAEEEKNRIIQAAQAEADRIISAAKEQAKHELETLESSMRIASKKAVDTLKLSIEKNILTAAVNETVKSALSGEEMVKEFIKLAVDNLISGQSSAEVLLPENLSAKLESFIKTEVASKAKAGIKLSSETVPSGFAVSVKDSSLMFDFTEDAVIELISGFLRPQIRKYLFEK
ncbi:MAG: hypothetical protein JW982_03830 [Spirochaetes bacterium]|nr:hypothetical protein [Spirochaetota bacterium]